MKKGTKQYERWEELPFNIDFKVYIFHVENPEEVMQGMKPELTEKGPYIYSQHRKKMSINLDNGTLSYIQYYNMTFNEEKSPGLSDTDVVTVLNSPLNGIMQAIEATPIVGRTLLKNLNSNLKVVFGKYDQLITSTTVKELLLDGMQFCINDPHILCDNIWKGSLAKTIRRENKSLYFSFFEHKQNHHDGIYAIRDGQENLNDLGRIISWENKTRLSVWPDKYKNSTCNMINGTDATVFPPLVIPGPSLDTFSTDICRSVRMDYKGQSSVEGINSFRYEVGSYMLEAQNENTTECFCVKKTNDLFTQENGCLKEGVMEMYPCLGAHVLLSLPHFLGADKAYIDTVNGLNPDHERHVSFLELEPTAGVPMAGSKRVQFNMITRKVPEMEFTNNLNPVLFPMIWVDESAVLPQDLIDEIKNFIVTPLLVGKIILTLLMVIGGVMIIVGLILGIRGILNLKGLI